MSSDDELMSLEDFSSTGSFMAAVQTEILNRSALKPLVWKRYIDDIYSQVGRQTKPKSRKIIGKTNNHHWIIKFTAHRSYTETTFLDTYVFKGERFAKDSISEIKTHFKSTATFQYTHFLRGQKGFHQGRSN